MIKWLNIIGKTFVLLVLIYLLFGIYIKLYFKYYYPEIKDGETIGWAWDLTSVIPVLFWICIFLLVASVLFALYIFKNLPSVKFFLK
jgi:hypothetical protein